MVMNCQLHALHPLITPLLPPTRAMRLTDVIVEPEDVCCQLTTTAPAACGPRGAVPSSTGPSRDQRHLTDLPWGTRPVHIPLTVRTCVGRHLHGTRRLFTARVPALVAAYARKTQRLIAALQALGVALGGQAGAWPPPPVGPPPPRGTPGGRGGPVAPPGLPPPAGGGGGGGGRPAAPPGGG